MNALAPAFAAVAALALAAGLAKLRSPAPAGLALSRLGLPGSAPMVRLIGASEVAIGTACLLTPGPLLALLLAASYVAFAAVVMGLVRLEADSVPCGCFGAGSFTATRAHAFFDLVGAGIAAIGVLAPPSGPLEWFADPLAGAAAFAAVGCSVWLAYVIFTLVPTIWAAPTA